MQIYNTITMKFLTLDERLDILLTLKHTVKVNEFEIIFRSKVKKTNFFSFVRNMNVVSHRKLFN